MTQAGELRERFAFDLRDTVADGLGNEQGEWLEQFQVAARRQMLRGGESVMASRLAGRAPAIVTIRSSSQARRITTEWRCRDMRSGETYNIRAVTPDEDRQCIDLLVESGVAV